MKKLFRLLPVQAQMRTLLITILIAAGPALVGCSRSSSPSSSTAVTALPQYHGQTRRAVESKLGLPVNNFKFPMSQAGDEMRAPLLATYPLTNPANASVMIEESWWKDGDYWITLWFHNVNGGWIVLNSCRWQKDVLF